MTEPQDHYTLHDLARLGGVELNTLRQMFRRGRLPKPTGRVENPGGKTYLWVWADSPELQEFISWLKDSKPEPDELAKLLTARDLAKIAGVAAHRIYNLLNAGGLAPHVAGWGKNKQGFWRDTPELRAAVADFGRHVAEFGTGNALPAELADRLAAAGGPIDAAAVAAGTAFWKLDGYLSITRVAEIVGCHGETALKLLDAGLLAVAFKTPEHRYGLIRDSPELRAALAEVAAHLAEKRKLQTLGEDVKERLRSATKVL